MSSKFVLTGPQAEGRRDHAFDVIVLDMVLPFLDAWGRNRANLACFVPAAPAQYRFDHWTADNGLPQNSLRDIVQTHDGYMWFTTYDGLVHFDGVRFTVFNKGNRPGLAKGPSG